jgi:hypothetical protein
MASPTPLQKPQAALRACLPLKPEARRRIESRSAAGKRAGRLRRQKRSAQNVCGRFGPALGLKPGGTTIDEHH